MPIAHGKDATVAWAGVDIEDELSSVSVAFSADEAETTSFADPWKNFLAGKPTAEISGEGFWDPAAGQGDVTFFGDLGIAAQTYNVKPDGSSGYDGYGILRNYTITASVNGAITYTFDVRHNGGSAAADGLAPNRTQG